MLLTIISLSLLALSAWYVPARLKTLLGLRRVWPLQIAVFLLLAGYYGLLVSGIYTAANPLAAVAYNALGLFFIFQIYLCLYLVATHVLAPLLRKLPRRSVAAAGILLCVGLVGLGWYQAQLFQVTRHEIAVRNLALPVTIMHIPDLHLGAQRSEAYLQRVIEAINQHEPDIVLYNGDLVDSNIALRPELFSLFQSVKAEQYFTTGNHEFYLDTDRALALTEGAGIRILRSEMVDTNGLQLIGLEYMNADRVTYDAHIVNDLTMEEELPRIQRSPDRPTVLVHHSPVGLQYVQRGRIDAMFSGHTHGGQVFPGTVLIGLRFPMHTGRHQVGDTTLLVSQGAGTFGPWMRLGTFNELQLVTLIPAAS
jgi:predicted MPP superfamily phosphohydrolase